jgi:hypothetical protein
MRVHLYGYRMIFADAFSDLQSNLGVTMRRHTLWPFASSPWPEGNALYI